MAQEPNGERRMTQPEDTAMLSPDKIERIKEIGRALRRGYSGQPHRYGIELQEICGVVMLKEVRSCQCPRRHGPKGAECLYCGGTI